MFGLVIAFLCGVVFYPVLKVLYDRLLRKVSEND
jgi:hypothetical protein